MSDVHPNTLRVIAAARDAGLEITTRRFPEGTKTAVAAATAIGVTVGQIVKSLVFGVDNEIVIDIEDKDLRIDVFRASGAGGQHVNKTSSAVRITHLPTNTVTQCQNDRSQHKNKDQAMKQLKAKLYELEMQKRRATQDALEDTKSDIGWGSQIRSYVLAPYRLIKDHRTNYETGNVDAVLDGDLERFIREYLLSK